MTRSLAHAKINLFLHITSRRENGYHELDSLAVFAETADILTLDVDADPQDAPSLRIEGPFGEGLDAGADNLVMRAASVLRQSVRTSDALPCWPMTLTKNLPVASGIGGGSADAAAALRLLAEAWQCGEIDLAPIAAMLGADVPVCLAQKPQRMQGIGEILVPAPVMPRCAMVLVNPGIAVPTPAIFKAWKESRADFRAPALLPQAWPDLSAMVESLHTTANDLQPPAIALFPLIGTVLEALKATQDCHFARMSGSGATCFGLYEDMDRARIAAEKMRERGWWAEPGWIQT
ncbi:4-diphosphocytidyl-2-C-methyl-D-erythritol kinase [Asaia krungthepensis NRIC 0535]|uniref:4-diphosphocytidyl-2-C-methyl-D-erythritol kinase n=2 Tax=Asaia krungthepensis TaxID=220990 RepID=A0ABQ0Q3H1_9PROT|nr:4-(cytidine 5'-diphospho)-2-C-methyl-D-erythritol kinase [Asaia krungthepensis]GBQ89599.1 4-diphosphocytidyl-2-C-methyl-D-erythritol kinase [Asaia krungthepensis NRIC 0535]